MSMYNLMHGRNPLAQVLVGILQCVKPFEIGRFRDAYLNEDGTEIIVYTRNGGGNRECYCDGQGHDEGCLLVINEEMTKHPLYVRDYDDDFDSTYAYFVFSVPEKLKGELTEAARIQGPPQSVGAKCQDLCKRIESGELDLRESKAVKEMGEALKGMIEGGGHGIVIDKDGPKVLGIGPDEGDEVE